MFKTTKNKIIVAITVAVLIVVAILYFKGSKPVKLGAVSGQLIEDNIPYFRNNGGMNTALPIQTTGGFLVTGSINQNGLVSTSSSVALLAATTTPCEIQTPSATSSITFFAINASTATATAITIDIGTSTAPNSTSTGLYTTTWGSGIPPVLSVQPSNMAIVGPNLWLTLGIRAGANNQTSNITGTCKAEFYII